MRTSWMVPYAMTTKMSLQLDTFAVFDFVRITGHRGKEALVKTPGTTDHLVLLLECANCLREFKQTQG